MKKQKNAILTYCIVGLLAASATPSLFAETSDQGPYEKDTITLINEGFESGIPAGWFNSGWLENFYGSPHSGSGWIYSWAAGDTLTTPVQDFGSNTELSFWYAVEQSSTPMTLQVKVDSTIVWEDIDFTHTSYIEAVVDLSSYTGGHTISFYGATSAFYGQTLDDILLTTEIDLTPPEIENVIAEPPLQTTGQSVTISCDVSDNEEVGNVYANITYPDTTMYTETMSGSTTYTYDQIFTMNGVYLYHIYAIDINGNSAESPAYTFEINLPPISDFSFTPLEPTTADTVIFTDSSTDPDGSIISWYWDFGDGTDSTQQNPTHAFDNGVYTVTLTITDDDGATDSALEILSVLNLEPIADFEFSPIDPSTVDTVSFTDLSSDPDGSIISWDWNFGDGGSSTTQHPTHNYADDGTYVITLTVTDDDGGTDTTTDTISVENVAPIADFLFDPLEPTVTDTISFTDTSSDSDGTIISWYWDFGDGTDSTDQYPTHQYLEPDEYTVWLTVTDDDGAQDSIEQIIIVTPPVEVVDCNQSIMDRGFPIRHALDGDWAAAQSFIPTKNVITKADLYLRKFGTPEFNLTVELREDQPVGTLVDSLIFTPDLVSTNWEWFTIDFQNVTITNGVTYFIVIPPVPGGVTTSFGYEWGYAFGNQYDDGSFWFTRDGGGLWRDLPTMYEFAFKTYGL